MMQCHTLTLVFLYRCSTNRTRLSPQGGVGTSSRLYVGDAQGDYYGESNGSFMVKEFSVFEQLQEIIKLAAEPLPERPDGIVCVAKFTSATREDCRATEAQYEQFARQNPATIFLRCFEEDDNANLLMGQAAIQSWPTYDVFYKGNRVARVDGPDFTELEELLQMYQFQNSALDLFSEGADNKKRLAWEDGKLMDPTKTPRTTNAFIPGYDMDKDGGFFDDQADKAQDNFEDTFGNWLPNIDDE